MPPGEVEEGSTKQVHVHVGSTFDLKTRGEQVLLCEAHGFGKTRASHTHMSSSIDQSSDPLCSEGLVR